MTTAWKKGLIASVKIAQKGMGLDDATYRAMLEAITGKSSATACSVPQLKAVLAHMKERGWKPKPRATKDPLAPLRKKIAAQCAALGKDDDYAGSILARMYGVGATIGTASRAQLTACISALTRQQQRAAS